MLRALGLSYGGKNDLWAGWCVCAAQLLYPEPTASEVVSSSVSSTTSVPVRSVASPHEFRGCKLTLLRYVDKLLWVGGRWCLRDLLSVARANIRSTNGSLRAITGLHVVFVCMHVCKYVCILSASTLFFN